MQIVSKGDLEWATAANPSLALKNILTNFHVSAGTVSCGISRWAYGRAVFPTPIWQRTKMKFILCSRAGGE